jgi:hypothetical protein
MPFQEHLTAEYLEKNGSAHTQVSNYLFIVDMILHLHSKWINRDGKTVQSVSVQSAKEFLGEKIEDLKDFVQAIK